MRYINVESDFKLLESFDCNCEVNLRDSEFEFEYYTKKHSDNRITVSYKDGKCSSNCKFTKDNRLIVLFENHNLEPGTLKVKRYFNLNDADFSDKTCDFVIEEELPISLTKGIQPCTEECCYVDVKLPPYYQKGDIGPVGPKGDKGDQGDKGDKGDLTVTGATPHNNLLDNTAFNQFDYEDNLSYWNIRGSAEIEIHGGENGIGNNALLIKSYEDLADNTVNPSTLCIKGIGYVLSLYTKAYNNKKRTLLINIPNLHRGLFYVDGQQGKLNNLGYISLEQSTNWEKHYITFTVSGESPIFFVAPSTANDGVLIAQVKLESNPINGLPDLANLMPTPWTLSANDLKGKDIYELLVESNKFNGTREDFEDEYTNSIKDVKNATKHAIDKANDAQMIGQHVQQVERDILQREDERSDAFDLAQSNRQQAYEDAEDIRNSEYRKAESSRNSGFGSAENTRNNIFLQYESTRQNNETLRSNAEEDRKKAESDRQALFQSNEESRQNTFNTNETTRQNKEIIRQTKEAERETKEAERQSIFSTNEAERQRIFETNETIREENEAKRVDAEILRQEAETIREATYKNKVDRDDNAPKLTAGFANNLVGRGEATSEEISFRPSGGDTSIEDGTARIDRVKGNTLVWNQCDRTSDGTLTNSGITFNWSNGVLIVNGTATIGFPLYGIQNGYKDVVKGHKVCSVIEVSDGFSGSSSTIVTHGVKNAYLYKGAQNSSIIANATGTSTYFYMQFNQGDVFDNVKIKSRLYDLTQMFGAGNEPTTIEEFNARKPIGIDEYAYNEGELISNNVDEIKSVGFNAWDEEWEKGGLSPITGIEEYNEKLIRAKNYIQILPSTIYYCSNENIEGGEATWAMFFDGQKNLIKGYKTGRKTSNNAHDILNHSFTTPATARYMRFYTRSKVYNHDICIHLAHTGYRNGEYEPYKEFRRSIPIKDIKDKDGNQLFPNGLLSAGSVYDEITATKAIKRIGVVDMGTLEWNVTSEYSYLPSSVYGDLISNNMLSVYDIVYSSDGNLPTRNDKYIQCYPPTVFRMRNVEGYNASQIKELLQGTLLYYELAEPIEVDLAEPLNLDYEVSDFGTEEVISSEPTTPMKADIIYQFNAVDRIRDNSRHTAEAAGLLNAKADKATVEAAINELTNAIPEVVNDLTEGGEDKALSAEIGKELGKNCFELNITINGESSVVTKPTDSGNRKFDMPFSFSQGKDYNLTLRIKEPLSNTLYWRLESEGSDIFSNRVLDIGQTSREYAIKASKDFNDIKLVLYCSEAIPEIAMTIQATKSLVDDIKTVSDSVHGIRKDINTIVADTTSVGKISLYPGISTSMSKNYTLSEIIPANIECNVVINIENNAIPRGVVYFRGKNNNIITTIANAVNGYSTTINLAEDAHYVSFSLTDSTIANTGDFIVNVSAKGVIAEIREVQEEVQRDIVNVQEGIKNVERIVTTLQSVGFISLYKGISTSSSTNYPLSEVIPANKECSINVVIENNAIPMGTVYFRDKDKKTLFTATNVRDGYSLTKEFDADVHYVAFSLTDSTITGTGDFIVNLSVDGEIEKELKNVNSTLQIHSQRIDNLESSQGGTGKTFIGDTLSKEIINATRPYYFAQGWSEDDNFGYLDEKLAEIPSGKHFIVFSDIHIDYYANYGLKQKQAIIMKYIHDRLGGCQVVYLGDFLGTQPTEEQAKKIMKWFSNEYYTLFGGNFVPALGDHDTDRVNGGLPAGGQLTEEFIYNAYFKQAYNYGAVGDKAIKVIDNLSLSDLKKDAWKNYMKMHYYKDDPVNKVRTIIVQQGAVFRNIPDNYNCSGIQLPFIANAMATAPNDYAIVIASHEYHLNKTDSTVPSNYWETKLIALAKAFKNGESYTLTKPQFSVDEETMIWNAVSAEYPSVYDFNGRKGEVVILQGDEHFDYVSYCNGDTMMNVSAVDANPTDSDVLYVLVDRACTVENAGFPYSQFTDIEYTIKTMRRAKAGNLIGTTDEVLFDVMTINENGLTITRIGDTPEAGIVGTYEVFDSAKNYNVGDMVTWYEDVPETTSYRPYIYKFIRQHSASNWNFSDVEKVNIAESYNRTYKI